jgi:hypothetical protein
MTSSGPAQEPGGHATTLDDLFRRAAVRNSEAVALVDPPDRAAFTSGPPLSITYAHADRIVWAIAARLYALGLERGEVVAIQLPNTVESILTLLGVLRAGMVVALLPMLWREREIVAALSGTGAKALLTTTRINEADHCDIAMKVAAQLMSIRHVCAYGRDVPDGVVPLDDVLTPQSFVLPARGERSDPAAGQTAILTFEPTPRGVTCVARTHPQILAGGLSVALTAKLKTEASLLSATPISSWAGLCATLMPWLLSGERLVLEHAFDASSFAQAAMSCDAIVVPGPLLADLASDGVIDARTKTVIALWPSPERAETASRLSGSIVDLRVFGEVGVVATRRNDDGAVAALPTGSMSRIGLDLKRTDAGTLALRGMMVGLPGGTAPPDNFIDTGYPCRAATGCLVVTGAKPGMITIGGYRLPRSDLDALATTLQADELIAALPDKLLGQRLAAPKSGRDDVADMLTAQGVNPLISGAFSRRHAA